MTNPWTALSLGVIVLMLAWLAAAINAPLLVALAIGAVLSFIFPPLGIAAFGAAILYFVFVKGQAIMSRFNTLVKGGKKV